MGGVQGSDYSIGAKVLSFKGMSSAKRDILCHGVRGYSTYNVLLETGRYWNRQRNCCWAPFLKSPENFRAHFGWHNSLCIFKTKASRGRKLCSYFTFYSLYNIWKDQLFRIGRLEFNEWLSSSKSFRTYEKPRRINYGEIVYLLRESTYIKILPLFWCKLESLSFSRLQQTPNTKLPLLKTTIKISLH